LFLKRLTKRRKLRIRKRASETASSVERVKVTEHFLAVEYVTVRSADRCGRPHEKNPELAA
jgi:hypothetical protein